MRSFTAPGALLLVAVAAFVAGGCATPRPAIDRDLPEAFPHHSADQIVFNVATPGDTLQSFLARASVAIRSPENSGQFSAEMRERRGDSLYVSLSPGLGIEAARALVTVDSFFFYDRIKNRLVFGSLDQASEVLPDPFTSEDLFENLLGLVAPARHVRWSVENDSSYYFLRDEDGERTYVVDPAYWRVVRFEHRDSSGMLLERRSFSEFDTFGGIVLPRRLIFTRPLENRTATIYYRNLTINPSGLTFDLRVRDTAERVPASD